jgi:DNA-binding MarR family transcriptional regulator
VTSDEAATAFGELFPAVYLRFHRRDGKRAELPGASRAVLQHLAGAGPLTIGELAAHVDRAQSVASEIARHLERDGLLERIKDPRDRRRTLVWLTDAGTAALAHDRDVLSRDRVAAAMAHMTKSERAGLIAGMTALIKRSQS